MVPNNTYTPSIVLHIDKIILDGPSSATIFFPSKSRTLPSCWFGYLHFTGVSFFWALVILQFGASERRFRGSVLLAPIYPPSIECGFKSDTLLPLFPFLGTVSFSHFLTASYPPLFFLHKKKAPHLYLFSLRLSTFPLRLLLT